MQPLRIHETVSDFFDDKTVELRLSMRTSIHAGRLKEYPAETKEGVRKWLMLKLNKIIDDTDFADVDFVRRNGGIEGDYGIE